MYCGQESWAGRHCLLAGDPRGHTFLRGCSGCDSACPGASWELLGQLRAGASVVAGGTWWLSHFESLHVPREAHRLGTAKLKVLPPVGTGSRLQVRVQATGTPVFNHHTLPFVGGGGQSNVVQSSVCRGGFCPWALAGGCGRSVEGHTARHTGAAPSRKSCSRLRACRLPLQNATVQDPTESRAHQCCAPRA